MIRKGQVRGVGKGDSTGQVTFIARLFGVAASAQLERGPPGQGVPLRVFATPPLGLGNQGHQRWLVDSDLESTHERLYHGCDKKPYDCEEVVRHSCYDNRGGVQNQKEACIRKTFPDSITSRQVAEVI